MARNRAVATIDEPVPFIKELTKTISAKYLPIFAAAIAFFAFLAMIPAIAATLSIVGLAVDTDELVTEVESALEASPEQTREFVVQQVKNIAQSEGAGLTAVFGVLLSLFSASGAVGNLMSALNVVFDREENRNFLVKRGTAIVLLLGSILLLGAMVFTMSVLPALLSDWTGSTALQALVGVARFVGLGLIVMFGLSTLYRLGPAPADRSTFELVPGGKQPLISVGGVVGTVLFVVLSWGFGFFVDNFGSYGETYGPLATIVVVLLWLQLVSLGILIGAQVDAIRAHRAVGSARVGAGLSREVPVLDEG